MQVTLLNRADKSDPLNEGVVLLVKDGDKRYLYRMERLPHEYEIVTTERLFAEALDDLIYHDGEKGRAAVLTPAHNLHQET